MTEIIILSDQHEELRTGTATTYDRNQKFYVDFPEYGIIHNCGLLSSSISSYMQL